MLIQKLLPFLLFISFNSTFLARQGDFPCLIFYKNLLIFSSNIAFVVDPIDWSTIFPSL
mgnify:CR=1 FL=1